MFRSDAEYLGARRSPRPYPRRGVAASRLRGLSTSRPRRRRESADYPRPHRGVAAIHRKRIRAANVRLQTRGPADGDARLDLVGRDGEHGVVRPLEALSVPEARRSRPNCRVPAAALLVSAEYARPSRGGAATSPRGICTSQPRRRRDSSPRNLHVPAAAAPRLVSTKYPRRSRGGGGARFDLHPGNRYTLRRVPSARVSGAPLAR